LQQEEELVRPEWMERGSRKTSYMFVTGAVLLVGVVLAVFSMRGPKEPVLPAQEVKTDNVAPVVSAKEDTAVAEPKEAAKPVDTVVASSSAARIDNVVKAAPAAAPASSTEASASETASLTGPFKLFLEASDHTWIMYSFDGGEQIDVTLFVGDKISIQADKNIVLKIGNAGGVVATLNGQRLSPLGKSGQVRTINFGR
jgi:cytoskeleton protein RodZ